MRVLLVESVYFDELKSRLSRSLTMPMSAVVVVVVGLARCFDHL